MERKFDTTLQYGSDYTWLKIQGVIDEDNSLARLSSRIQGSFLILDLAEVERINSCGVRDWVNWLHAISATGIRVVMIRCSPAIINQVNMVTNFIGEAVIHSFYAPYFNPETEQEKSVLLFTKDVVGQSPVRAPEVRCDETGYLLEFDDFEESYFAFASSAADPRALPPAVVALIESLTPELSSRNATSNARTTRMTQQGALDAAAREAAARLATSPQTPSARNDAFSSNEATVPRPAHELAGLGAAAPPPRPPAPPPPPPLHHSVPRMSGAQPAAPMQMPTQPMPPPPHAASFVTDPRAAAGAGPGGGFVEPLESDGRSSALIIGALGVVLVLVLVLLLWLTLS